jgi:hypothetical protein
MIKNGLINTTSAVVSVHLHTLTILRAFERREEGQNTSPCDVQSTPETDMDTLYTLCKRV